MNKAKLLLTAFVISWGFQAQAGLLFNYSQLAIKDLDQMNKIVENGVKEAKKSSAGKEVPLKEALQAVYSRPNEDEVIEKVVGPLRAQLDQLDAWEKTVSQLTDEALNALRNPRAFKPVVQVTYVVFLENLLSDLKPYAVKPGFEREIVQRIKNANIQVSKDAVNERKVRTMKSTVSPSELAEQVLNQKVPATPAQG